MVICLERDADLHVAQLMPLPLTVSCFSKIQIGFTFLVPAHLGSHGKRAVKRVSVCVLGSLIILIVSRALRLAMAVGGKYRPVKLLSGGALAWLSGARCRLAYGPADATATHCLLLQ